MGVASRVGVASLPPRPAARAHLHLVAVEEVHVGLALLRVLAHEQQHGRVAQLVEHRLAVLHGGQREVLQLLLQGRGEGPVPTVQRRPGGPPLPRSVPLPAGPLARTLDSTSSSRSSFSFTCSSTSCVQIFSLALSCTSFLMASSTVTMASLLSMMNVARCCGTRRPWGPALSDPTTWGAAGQPSPQSSAHPARPGHLAAQPCQQWPQHRAWPFQAH